MRAIANSQPCSSAALSPRNCIRRSSTLRTSPTSGRSRPRGRTRGGRGSAGPGRSTRHRTPRTPAGPPARGPAGSRRGSGARSGTRSTRAYSTARPSAAPSSEQLLASVDVVRGAGERGVGHQVDGQRGDVVRADDAADRQRGAQLFAAGIEAGRRAARPTAACRRTRARSGSRGSARARAPGSWSAPAARRCRRSIGRGRARCGRPPVPPMNVSVPPGRSRAARASRSGSAASRWSRRRGAPARGRGPRAARSRAGRR